MRKLIVTAAIAAAALASPAYASNSAQTEVNASLAQSCAISNVSPSLTLGGLDVPVQGAFTYSCNFTGQPSITIQSANGGVATVDNNNTYKVNYGVWVNDAAPSSAPSAWAQASNLTGPGQTFGPSSGFLTTTAPNAPQNPYYYVGRTSPITVAGTYTDTLTFTINP